MQRRMATTHCRRIDMSVYTAQKMKFFIKDFFSKFPADLVAFTEEILNGKLHFLCSDINF